MYSKTLGSLFCACTIALGACSQQSEPVPIQPQPIYDKYGDVVGCEGGTYVPGSNYENPCEPPPEGCEDPQTASTAAGIPCPPPRDDNDDRDPGGRGGQTGAPTRG